MGGEKVEQWKRRGRSLIDTPNAFAFVFGPGNPLLVTFLISGRTFRGLAAYALATPRSEVREEGANYTHGCFV